MGLLANFYYNHIYILLRLALYVGFFELEVRRYGIVAIISAAVLVKVTAPEAWR